VNTPEAGQGLVGLRVDQTNQNACSVIYWPPQRDLEKPVPQTVPVVEIFPEPSAGQGLSDVMVKVKDAEGNNVRLTLYWQPANGTAAWHPATIADIEGSRGGWVAAPTNGSTYRIVWDAAADLSVPANVTVRLKALATDVTLSGESQPRPYQVTISAGNPIAHADTAEVEENHTVEIPVLANDSVQGGLPLSILTNTPPSHGSAAPTADRLRISYAPVVGYIGPDHFSYTVTDRAAGTSSATVNITVTPVSQPPEFFLVSPAAEPPGFFRLSISGSPGQTYVIQKSSDLADPDGWIDVATNFNTTGTVSYSEALATNETATYFRAKLIP